jgi:hypothetical protein
LFLETMDSDGEDEAVKRYRPTRVPEDASR